MQFVSGLVMFALSLSVLGWLGAVSARGRENVLLRGEIVPSLVCVAITAGLALGLILMVTGGAAYTQSAMLEGVVIAGIIVACGFVVTLLARSGSTPQPA